MERNVKATNFVTVICIYFLLILFVIGVLRDVIWRTGIDVAENNNFLVDIIYGQDKDKFKAVNFAANKEINIDWEKQYPFFPEDIHVATSNVQADEASDVKQNKIRSYIQDKYSVENVAKDNARKQLREKNLSKYILGYQFDIECVRTYDKFLNWQITAPDEYNGVKDIGDGYFAQFVGKVDTTEMANNLIGLSQFCKERNVKFLYVQAPGVICKSDRDITGKLDFSNHNADQLLQNLNQQIEYLDLRSDLDQLSIKESKNYHEYFFRTDHHWLPTTGLWAAGQIAQQLSKICNYDFNPQLFDRQNYNEVIYSQWFLGSAGKKVTLAKTEPDDFSLLYPKFDVDLDICIPSRDYIGMGRFENIYDMSCIEPKSYYTANSYSAYSRGDNAVIHFINHNVDRGKMLFVKDSFANSVVPFLALSVHSLDVIDLRVFKGSLKSYIATNKPEVVIVQYYTGDLNVPTYDSHEAVFDFR